MDNQKIYRRTVVEQVMERFRDLISSGEYKTGEKFPKESILAERFGIGRSSIREAVKILHYIGVLDSSTGRGTFVCDWKNISAEVLSWTCLLGGKDYHELMDLRYVIEQRCISVLTREYIEKTGNALETVEKLETIVNELETAAGNQDKQVLMNEDFEFHNLIIQHNANPVFSMIYQMLRSFFLEVNKEMFVQYQQPHDIFQEHRTILDLIKSGDARRASDEIFFHTEDSKKRIDRILARGSE
ncbi:MAG: FadR family transcriptional regulator [Spirochaetales bacterium]|nr:FadR family transcriptional regulator [Spirochaetales bacterium]